MQALSSSGWGSDRCSCRHLHLCMPLLPLSPCNSNTHPSDNGTSWNLPDFDHRCDSEPLAWSHWGVLRDQIPLPWPKLSVIQALMTGHSFQQAACSSHLEHCRLFCHFQPLSPQLQSQQQLSWDHWDSLWKQWHWHLGMGNIHVVHLQIDSSADSNPHGLEPQVLVFCSLPALSSLFEIDCGFLQPFGTEALTPS